MMECLAMGESFIEQVNDLLNWLQSYEKAVDLYIPLKEGTLLAPIPRPNKNIFCVGKNYAEHAIEMGSAADIPEHVMVFTKAPTTVIGPEADVLYHQRITSQLDYEGELAVIIGKKGRAIKKEEATYREIEPVRKIDQQAVQRNYEQVKQDIQEIIQSEMERLLADPALAHLIVRK